MEIMRVVYGITQGGKECRPESKAGDSPAWNRQTLRKPEGEIIPAVGQAEADHD
jgi:hypothetical protein